MVAREAIPSLIERGKNSTAKAFERVGRARSYVSTYLTNGHVPKADAMSAMLDTEGYDGAIINRETGEIIIAPDNQ